jgi:excisionase family DNA binding protein
MRFLSADERAALMACPCLRTRQAEVLFNINRNALYRLMREGELPYTMVGTVRLIRVADLQRLITPKIPAVAAE